MHKKLTWQPLAAAASLTLGGAMLGPGCKEIQQAQQDLCCSDFVPGKDLSAVNWGLEGQAEANYGALMQAIADFTAASVGMVTDVANACQSIAVDLGESPTAVTETDAGLRAQQWCSLAKARIGELTIAVSFQPPSCNVNVNVQASCEASCNIDASCELTPAQIVARCEPGQLTGKCTAQCQGTCEGSANLAVACEGTCQGACEGTCEGTCDKETLGGDCKGKCAGKCVGECRGSCVYDATATVTCDGDCTGGCSVDYQAPKCKVDLTPPSAECNIDANCAASCQASASAKAECVPPTVLVTGDTDLAMATLKKNLPAILTVAEARAQLLIDQADAVAQAAAAADYSSVKAVACLIPAGAAIQTAVENLAVSLDASVLVVGALGT